MLPMFVPGTADELIRVDGQGCFRYGILASMSNGMHDLVCNEAQIATWNGESYVWQLDSNNASEE